MTLIEQWEDIKMNDFFRYNLSATEYCFKFQEYAREKLSKIIYDAFMEKNEDT
jgi:hypothetical protein